MTLNISLEHANRFMHLIDTRMDGVHFNNNLKSKIVNGLLHLSLEHFGSIKLLITNKMIGSAAALLRPQYEALMRGLYFNDCAKDIEIESFADGKNPIKLHKIIECLETHYEKKSSSISDFYQKLKTKMHSYTHGGIEQLEHRFTENELVSSFSEAECIQLLSLSQSLAAIAVSCAAIFVEREDLANEFIALMSTE